MVFDLRSWVNDEPLMEMGETERRIEFLFCFCLCSGRAGLQFSSVQLLSRVRLSATP